MKPTPRQAVFSTAAFLFFCFTQISLAQLPATRLSAIFPPGGNPGTQVEVVIAGADLDDVNKIEFSQPGIVSEQKMAEPGPFDEGPQPVLNTFIVTIAGNVPPGVYDARVTGKYGLSNPRAFVVSTLAEAVEVEPNNTADTATEVELPLTVNGRANGAADVDFFKCTAPAGQRILAECFARRIDSAMDPVLTVFDQDGRELVSSRNNQRGEPLVDFNVPSSGSFYLKVSDAVYRGGNQHFYRLKIGPLPHIDYIFPPAGAPGGGRPFTIFGRNLPGGQAAGITLNGRPLQKINATISIPAALPGAPATAFIEPENATVDLVAYQVNASGKHSNTALVGSATAPPLVEKEPNNESPAAQKVALPCEIQGQFYPQRDRDWFEFEAKKDETLFIEVISQRLGVATDPMIVVQQVTTKEVPATDDQPATTVEQLKTLATVDEPTARIGGPEFDARSTDPVHTFKAPADSRYRILVRDSQSTFRADPRNVYRLAIRPPKPDFRLVAVPEESYSALLLRKGGRAAIRVVAFRRDGFDGDITVTASGLPAGVTASPTVIGAGRNSACMILSTDAGAAPASGLIQLVGKSQIAGADVTRPASFGTAVTTLPPRQNNNQPQQSAAARLCRSLAVSVSATETAPVAVAIGNGKVYETSRAGQLKIPYTRSGDFKGKINATGAGLPANAELKAFAINPNANSGEFPINLKNNTPVGTYTIHLALVAEKIKYARNPEAAAAAVERKKQVDQIAAEATAANKAATDAKAAADKAATEAGAAAKAATDKKTATDQALTQAMTALKSATDKANQAKAAAAAKPDDANLASAATAAQQAVTTATANVKTAQNAVAAAAKTVEETAAAVKATADAKTAADTAAEEAAARLKAATELKANVDKLATDTAAAAKPKDINVPLVSAPITIKVTPAPVTLALAQPSLTVKQGEKVEVPISINRLYGFAEAVTVSAPAPSGVSGLSIPNATIKKGENATKLTINAAATATDGQHTLTVRASMKLNNQDLRIEQPLTLNVQKVEQPAK